MNNRGESIAYPQTGGLATIHFLVRQNSRAVLATFAFLAFVLILSLDAVQKKYNRIKQYQSIVSI